MVVSNAHLLCRSTNITHQPLKCNMRCDPFCHPEWSPQGPFCHPERSLQGGVEGSAFQNMARYIFPKEAALDHPFWFGDGRCDEGFLLGLSRETAFWPVWHVQTPSNLRIYCFLGGGLYRESVLQAFLIAQTLER